jgi:hypothetical protein
VNSHLKILLFGLLLVSIASACASIPFTNVRKSTPSISTSSQKCPSLPTNFTDTDLIGVWKASYAGGADTDMLVIREDGTYRQIYDYPSANFHYESPWQQWSIEDRTSGYLRLHLQGMHRCDVLLSTCERKNGGLDPAEFISIDYCENQVIEMPDEVVLIVTGVPENEKNSFLREIELRQTRISGSDWTWSFHFSGEEQK